MRISVLQPPYPYQAQKMPVLVDWLLSAMDGCDDSIDLIVLPG